MLAVVGRVGLVDEGAPIAGKLRPAHIDAILEGAADMVVDGHELLVEQLHPRGRVAGRIGEDDDVAAREVPGCAAITRGAEDDEGAGRIRVGRRGPTTIEE